MNTKSLLIAILSTASILIGATCYADDNSQASPLMGSWKWESGNNDCKTPDFVFKPKKIVRNGDADGTPVRDEYKNIKYTKKTESQYLVDFGDQIGLAGTLTETTALIDIKNSEIIVINRKPMDYNITLKKCPAKK